tara:strand:- start:1406 stop:1534 length:129 start_codon:yes stop_codon:yes gene_type:complete
MFIYTVNDIIGAIFFGLMLLIGLFMLVLTVFYKIKRKFKGKK